jgi:hypothetical protein
MGPIEAAQALKEGVEKIKERSFIQTYVNSNARLRHERQQIGITRRQQRKLRTSQRIKDYKLENKINARRGKGLLNPLKMNRRLRRSIDAHKVTALTRA